MKEVVLFSKTKATMQKDDERIETTSVSSSVLLYIVLILFIVAIAIIIVLNCVSIHIQQTSNSVREVVNSSNDIVAVSSWIIGGIALVITILTVIKEIHSANVSSLKEKIRKKQKTIIKLGQSWLVLYSAGKECALDKKTYDEYRKKFSDENGVLEMYTPSKVKSILNDNML